MILLVVLASVVGLVQGLSFVSASRAARALASAASGTAGEFVSLQGRILDTRASSQVGPYNTPMPAGVWRKVPVDGVAGVPSSGVAAVAVDFTVVAPTYGGVIHADKDEATPNATVTYLNYTGGVTSSDTATLAVGSDGEIQVLASTSTNLLIDVQGYYTAGAPAAGGYVPVTPQRIVDTRSGLGLPKAKLASRSTSTIQVTGKAGVPAGASGVMVNFTIVDQGGPGWYVSYPADASQPLTSIDYGSTPDANGAQVGLSSTGAFKFFNSGASTDLLVDVVGYFTASTSGGAFTPATARVLDTRSSGHSPIGGYGTLTVPVAGVAGVPLAGSGISAVTTNVAVIDAGSNPEWIRVWAHGAVEPSTSSLNYNAPGTTSNMVTSALGSDGAIEIHNMGADSINVVVDVEGWYANTGAAISNGQHQTQQSVSLQASPTGGPWVTYQYRIGTTASFSNVPVTNVQDANGNSPAAWPVQKSGNAFTAYTWNIRNTLIAALGSAPASLIQVQACYGTSATDPNPACGMPSDIQFAQSAFGAGFATQDEGPGTLAELTGDYQVSATDANVSSSLGGLSLGRSLTTLAPPDAGVAPGSQRSGASGIFGPAWTADLSGPTAGDADLTVTDQTSAGYLLFTDTDGSVAAYQATTSTASYPIGFAGVGDAAGDGETVVKLNASTITMTDPDNTVTTWTKTGSVWSVSSVAQPGSNATSTYSYNAAGLVTRVLAPVPAGVSCSAPDTTPGCRSLVLDYETLSVSGVNLTRLQDVKLSIPQTTGTANEITVAAYDYTSAGLLADAYDPRISPALKTSYTYDSQDRLASLTPAGQAAWSFGYDSAGRLSAISRPDPSGSTATTTIVYDVPMTGSTAPIDLSAATTGTWDETSDLPVTGTAIFPATHQPAGSTASTVNSTDWPYASIDYLDVNGRQVNTASYGAAAWQIDTHQYDGNGNDVWDLSAGNRAQALNPASDTDPYVAGLSSNVARAALLASSTVFNPLNPAQVTDTYGPAHPVTLHDGTVIDAQTHVATSYDQGAPNADVNPATGQAYGLKTTEITDAYNVATQADTSYPDAHTVRYGYAAIDAGDTDGWTLAQPTSTTVQMGASPSGADLVTITRYDGNGRTIEQRLPGDATGSTPRTTLTTYYTTTGSGACVSAPSAGLVCSTGPVAQPSSGNPLPITTYSYDQYGSTTSKTETYGTGSGQVTRTSSTGYDSAERETSNSITVSPASAGGTPVPAVTFGYDPNTGLQTSKSTGSGSAQVTLTTGYDDLGRVTSYTDATGNVTTTSYDLDGRVVSVDDGKGTTAYGYDTATEHRGLITSEDIGVTGSPSTFAASYDPDGNLATETYPNGLIATRDYDNTGGLTKLAYAKAGSTWMRFTQAFNALGQVTAQSSPQSSQTLGYDGNDRLTSVQDTYQGACTTRIYAFDADSNRTSLNTYPAAGDGTCTTSTTPATATTSYDQADRDTNTGYSYDSLGRTATVPGADAQGIGAHASASGDLTVGYYANDMVASQSQGGASLSFTLDPDQNRVNSSSDGTTTTTDHYGDDTDSPAWTSTDASTWTRDLSGPDGNLAATAASDGTVNLELPNAHGDIVATCADDPSATSISSYSESTEYGLPRNAPSAYTTYGWLGAKQRSSDSLGGLALMGVRLYNPATGRFLSTDPIAGGNANAYTYPADPINKFDLNGMCWWGCSIWHHVKHIAKKAWHGFRKHVLNRHFWEGVEFGFEAFGAIGLGLGVTFLGGPFGFVPGIVIITAGGGGLGYASYRSFREAFR